MGSWGLGHCVLGMDQPLYLLSIYLLFSLLGHPTLQPTGNAFYLLKSYLVSLEQMVEVTRQRKK